MSWIDRYPNLRTILVLLLLRQFLFFFRWSTFAFASMDDEAIIFCGVYQHIQLLRDSANVDTTRQSETAKHGKVWVYRLAGNLIKPVRYVCMYVCMNCLSSYVPLRSPPNANGMDTRISRTSESISYTWYLVCFVEVITSMSC